MCIRDSDRTLSQTDPEYVKLFSDFAYGEGVNEPGANQSREDRQGAGLVVPIGMVRARLVHHFPVSEDVYKRQMLFVVVLSPAGSRDSLIAFHSRTVSYTHLDVYKRQERYQRMRSQER